MTNLSQDMLRSIEADSFWCMSKLLDGIQVGALCCPGGLGPHSGPGPADPTHCSTSSVYSRITVFENPQDWRGPRAALVWSSWKGPFFLQGESCRFASHWGLPQAFPSLPCSPTPHGQLSVLALQRETLYFPECPSEPEGRLLSGLGPPLTGLCVLGRITTPSHSQGSRRKSRRWKSSSAGLMVGSEERVPPAVARCPVTQASSPGSLPAPFPAVTLPGAPHCC